MRLGTVSRTAVVGAAVGDAVAAGMSRPFTLPADFAAGCGIALTVTAGLLSFLGRRRSGPAAAPAPRRRLTSVAVAVWTAFAVAVVAMELVSFAEHPRSDHPTLSSILAAVTGHSVSRGLLFAVWLGAGWWLWQGP